MNDFTTIKVNLEGLLMLTALVTLQGRKIHNVSLYADHACTRCICDDADRTFDSSQWEAIGAGVAQVEHDKAQRRHTRELIATWQQSIRDGVES